MTNVRKNERTKAEHTIRRSTLVTFLCDVLIILVLVVCLLYYNDSNNADTYAQNAENITNIATGKSSLMLAALENSGHEVENAHRYCSGRDVDDIMAYLSLIGNGEDEYQLLTVDDAQDTELVPAYRGLSTRQKDGAYIQVTYRDTDLAASIRQYSGRPAGEICFSQSFTNVTDGVRYFAAFCGVAALDNGEARTYYIVKPQQESRLLDQLQSFSQYRDLTTAIIYADGKYLARDSAFRSDNFYGYLYTYNGLSLDERNLVRRSVREDGDGVGTLKYRDYKGRDCLFAYAACGDDASWYVLVAVPTSQFAAQSLLSPFTWMIIIFLVVLLVFNTWRLLMIMNQLKQSVYREQAASMSKSSFLSRMSHEIRTPLNAIIGYNLIAKNEMTAARDEQARRLADVKVADCLTKSDIASKHLLSIINDVLDMSAIESGKIIAAHDRFDFRGLITSLTTVFYSQARAKGVDLRVVFDTLTEEWFVGDQIRVNQILTNILSNAIKFTPEGGVVTLKISQKHADEQQTQIHFTISDTGIGMSKEYLARLWTPFEQADSSISRRYGGTGLGLSITKNLIDLMGGEVQVESTPDVGTTFDIDLTFTRTQQPKNVKTFDFGAVSALVVDDDPGTCEYVRLLFERCGAHCETVTSGEAALERVRRCMDEGKPYTLCIVDWRMPGMDGIETIRRIREMVGETLPIIVLTAYDYIELADKAAALGIKRFISKPFFQSSLFDLLANVCGAKPTIDAPVQPDTDFAGARVLLAEDNVMNMEIAQTILQSAGLTVDCAWNGKEAVALFEASAPKTYMAILMDVHMPEMDGHEATRAIRASSHPEAQTVPIIAMTADAFAENVTEAYEAGMNAHIAKPIDINVLFGTLRKYCTKP